MAEEYSHEPTFFLFVDAVLLHTEKVEFKAKSASFAPNIDRTTIDSLHIKIFACSFSGQLSFVLEVPFKICM